MDSLSYQKPRNPAGFTLIELLIVVAIIGILAAIAVPNFLEAQTRAKVSRSKADMRSIETAYQSYLVDNNRLPKAYRPNSPPDGTYSFWWGFVSVELTTPVAYITSLPSMPFSDPLITSTWVSMGGSSNYRPYTFVRNTNYVSSWVPGELMGNNATIGQHAIDATFINQAKRAAYIVYTSGPDNLDATVWHSPIVYDPTNGTVSFGDIHYFGTGNASEKAGYVAGQGNF